MALDVFPIGLFQEASSRWYRPNVTHSGGISEGGLERLAVTDGGGKWMCEMTIPLLSNDGDLVQNVRAIKAARAIIEGMDGGATPMLVPFYADAEAPWPLGVPPADVPFSDGSTFSDGSEFESGAITITAAAAPLRATALTLTIVVAGDLIGGEMFSIQHPTRDHHIYNLFSIDGIAAKIRPPLREAISDGTVLNFDAPRCKMMLTNPNDCLSAITPPYQATLSPIFREAW